MVPVLKTKQPRELNHFRPVALTSHKMKTVERIVLSHFRPQVCSALDPLPIRVPTGDGVEDAVIYLLHCSLSHPDCWKH